MECSVHTCRAYVPGATYANRESLERAPATEPSTMVADFVIRRRCASIWRAISRTGSPFAAVAMSSSVLARSASTFQQASFMVWSPAAGLGWNREGHTNVRLPSSPAVCVVVLIDQLWMDKFSLQLLLIEGKRGEKAQQYLMRFTELP